MSNKTSMAQFRVLQADIRRAKALYGKSSPQHQAAYRQYTDTAGTSAMNMLRATLVEATSG